jgi:uncharacterized protein (DUF2235 family)
MKRIVICADGTWNVRDQVNKDAGRPQPTNVTKVARGVRARSTSGVDQVVFYHEGVGTDGGVDRLTGGAFGHGIEDNIRAIYRHLLYNYVDGDEIYMFGFSRGAFTVRSLAGFMLKVGLLEKDDDYYVPEIYDCYEKNHQPGSKEWAHAFRNIDKTFPCPPIKFLGVWDTVGALGAPGFLGKVVNRNKYKYHDVGLNQKIEHAYHAMAIDEQRGPFAPSIWTRPAGWTGALEQAWFAGVHCNIGGGYSPDGLANEALHWLIEKAEGLGLEFDGAYLDHFRPCFNSTLNNSMKGMYKVMGKHVRTLGSHVADGEAIHQSALDRFDLPVCEYRAGNLSECVAQPGTLPTVNTKRVSRGTPCEDLPPR